MTNLEKQFEKIKLRLQEIALKLQESDIFKRPLELKRLTQEKEELEEIAKKYESLNRINQEEKQVKEMLKEESPEFQKVISEELKILKSQKEKLISEIKIALLPHNPDDIKNAILEIRPAAGGDESTLFAYDLFNMYSKYSQAKGLKINILDANRTPIGGFKSITFEVSGKNAYSYFKYESGVHRVQRIPVTESGGRIHTSTTTVAVLPEVEEVDIKIRPEDLKIEVFRSSGPGGQHAQKTESAVRITHLPTKLTVSCQEARSQLKNREKALSILRAKIYQAQKEEEEKKLGKTRKSQIGTGDRSEKIRTYNFPQNRVTDHRINYTSHNLEGILAGGLDELVNKLAEEEQTRKLKEIEK